EAGPEAAAPGRPARQAHPDGRFHPALTVLTGAHTMRTLTLAACVAFWSVIVTLLAVAALSPAPPAVAQEEGPVIRDEELARPDQPQDCWMAIEGKVYDFTTHMAAHPTPPAVMLSWCRTEATERARTKGYGRDDS